jgi:hypothetical protein
LLSYVAFTQRREGRGGKEGRRGEGRARRERERGQKGGRTGRERQAFFPISTSMISSFYAWRQRPNFRRGAPVPREFHCTLPCRPGMRELSEEARAVLRDFILVYDLDGFFKGSTEITEGEGAQVLEYVTSMFELAGLPIPTTCMSAKGLAKRSKALRSSKQPFKKEHAKFHELIKFAFELCHVNTADGFLPAIAEASVRKPPSYWFPRLACGS